MDSRERDNLRQWLSARLDWLISAGQRRWISVLRLIGAALITLTVFFYFYWACFFWGITGVWSHRIGALVAVSWLAISFPFDLAVAPVPISHFPSRYTLRRIWIAIPGFRVCKLDVNLNVNLDVNKQ